MKRRCGFVSNSSSSSFIVAFATRPKTAEELCHVLFSDLGNFTHPYDDVSYSYGTDVVAKAVFDELERNKPASKDEILEVVRSGWFEGRPDHPLGAWDDKDKWAAYEKECKEAAEAKAEEFMGANPGMELFVLEFRDDTQLGCAIEHGGVFEGLPHLVVSHH